MNIWYPTPENSAENFFSRNFGVTFISPPQMSSFNQRNPIFKPHQETLEFSGRTPFNIIRLVVVIIIVRAVTASDLRASELDGLVMMSHAVKEQQKSCVELVQREACCVCPVNAEDCEWKLTR